ncbi:putative quinol monooxygenase [Paracoccus sp. SCSIO 75233]|uniref:putative quinol monooxygenase n=1 Tax=Paracoccus sp. SCSIO 75233 TaxID=3017782 RepID=UPI0022EFFDB7|nr:putative quinol monooxygenase [Paracoccus sp. SCSIO 75233]WBU53092.1 putative quinol monooxygenase [Paracoccus sp. SCSIO 75233]
MIYIVATHEAHPDCIDELRDALRDLVAPSRAETGCVRYDLHENAKQPGHFVFYEIWADMAAFKAHGETEHLQAFKAHQAELSRAADVIQLDLLD